MKSKGYNLIVLSVLLLVLGGGIFFIALSVINGSIGRIFEPTKEDLQVNSDITQESIDEDLILADDYILNCTIKDLSAGTDKVWNITFNANNPELNIKNFQTIEIDSLCGNTQVSNDNVLLNITIPSGQVGGAFTANEFSQFNNITDFNLELRDEEGSNSHISSYILKKDGNIYYTNTLIDDAITCKNTFLELKNSDIRYCGIALLQIQPDMNFRFMCEKKNEKLTELEFKKECDDIVTMLEINRK